MEFPIERNNLHAQFMARMLRVYSAIGLLTALVFFVLGDIDAVTMAVIFGGVVFVWTVVVWSWGGLGKGVIRIDTSGFSIRNKLGEHKSTWADVEDVSVTMLRQKKGFGSMLMRALLLDANKAFVLVKLKRMIRANPLTDRWYTRGLGIPILTKEIAIYPEDVTELAATASRYAAGSRKPSWERPFGVKREDEQ